MRFAAKDGRWWSWLESTPFLDQLESELEPESIFFGQLESESESELLLFAELFISASYLIRDHSVAGVGIGVGTCPSLFAANIPFIPGPTSLLYCTPILSCSCHVMD